MNIKYKEMRHVTITGKKEEKNKILEWVHRNSYTVDYCGPQIENGVWLGGTYEVSAHKQIDDGEEEEEV